MTKQPHNYEADLIDRDSCAKFKQSFIQRRFGRGTIRTTRFSIAFIGINCRKGPKKRSRFRGFGQELPHGREASAGDGNRAPSEKPALTVGSSRQERKIPLFKPKPKRLKGNFVETAKRPQSLPPGDAPRGGGTIQPPGREARFSRSRFSGFFQLKSIRTIKSGRPSPVFGRWKQNGRVPHAPVSALCCAAQLFRKRKKNEGEDYIGLPGAKPVPLLVRRCWLETQAGNVFFADCGWPGKGGSGKRRLLSIRGHEIRFVLLILSLYIPDP